MTEIFAFASSKAAIRTVCILSVLLLPTFRVHAQTSLTLASHAPAVVDVVALRIEFQPDTTRFTTGVGTFDGVLFEGVEDPQIDPLPHGDDYFDAHLRFLENYVEQVSDGKTRVRTHLLPEVIRVSSQMGAYSPTGLDAGSDAELSKLAGLVAESWNTAHARGVSLPPGLDPSNTAFILFHAGVGRDIELVGTSLDKTPQDIPSIFLDEQALERLTSTAIQIDGMPVTSTMVIPRTESRLGFNFLTDEPFLVELSTNGMLAASFLNYLRVPDLFNTETGESAIGPFGVMDALGIFAFSGLFPPEPSAWTKHYLGWADTIAPSAEGEFTHLTHSGDQNSNDAALIRISDAEYFLLENRHRDPEGDGVQIRVWTPQGEKTLSFENADPLFNTQTISGFEGGVVVDVDNYDFALPGGVDENDNPLLGGMLIWHIDDNRLAKSLGENAVNADPNKRAIDLEEADGAQDIGFASNAGFFGPRFDLGTPFDFWYEGNPVTVRTNTGQDIQLYENRFGHDTIPSTDSNAGTRSPIVITDFSPPGTDMSFRYERAETGGPVLLAEWPNLPVGSSWEHLTGDGVLFASQNAAGFWTWGEGIDGRYQAKWNSAHDADLYSEGLLTSGAGKSSPDESLGIRPAFTDKGVMTVSESDFQLLTGLESGWRFQSFRYQPSSNTGQILDLSPRLSWTEVGGEHRFFVGARIGSQPVVLTLVLNEDMSFDVVVREAPSPILDVLIPHRFASDILVVTQHGILDGNFDLVQPASLSDVATGAIFDGAQTVGGTVLAWASLDRRHINMLLPDGRQQVVLPTSAECQVTDPMFHHADGDDLPDLLFACGETIYLVHITAALHAGFPVTLAADVSAQPVLTAASDERRVVFAATTAGTLEGFTIGGGTAQVPGFPLSIGRASQVSPFITPRAISATSSLGSIKSWEFSSSEGRNISDSDLILAGRDSIQLPDEGRLLSSDETYNWPNPTRDGLTNIRFQVNEVSDVEVTIVDMVGTLVDSFDLQMVPAGVPSEIVWQTEAGSGVYLARVEARSASGKTDVRLVRIAIIR